MNLADVVLLVRSQAFMITLYNVHPFREVLKCIEKKFKNACRILVLCY